MISIFLGRENEEKPSELEVAFFQTNPYLYIYIYGHPPAHDLIVCFIHQKTLENTVFLLHTLLQKCDPKILKKVIDKTYRKPKKQKTQKK